MIIAVGLDIVALDRIDRLWTRYGARLVGRLLTPAELAAIEASGDPVARLAGRWAAKEAVLKALGTGWAEGLALGQIEVLNDAAGAPRLTLHRAAAARAAALGGQRWHLSISHERAMAVAVAILEGEPCN